MTSIPRLVLVLVATCVVAGCAGEEAPKPEKSDNPAGSSTSSLLLNGREVGGDTPPAVGAGRGEVADSLTPRRAAREVAAVDVEEWPEPALLPDGTIDDGADPFANGVVQVQPLPIEDDGAATRAIDRSAMQLRRVQLAQWNRWMDAGLRSPWQQDADPTLDSLVKVVVERCGGARSVATGIVLDDETVVTTVHAIESPSRRVRIASAFGASQHIPAMIRYIDVDDDIAVLKVPGLDATPMLFHVVTDDEPHWGYAYGVSRGGVDGTVRRTPAVVAMEAETLTVEQPDGLGERISDRSVIPFVGGVDSGFSGGVVMATNDPEFLTGWGFHGLIRARVPFRSNTGGIAVPAPLIGDALDANDRLDEWFERPVGRCPQWHR